MSFLLRLALALAAAIASFLGVLFVVVVLACGAFLVYLFLLFAFVVIGDLGEPRPYDAAIRFGDWALNVEAPFLDDALAGIALIVALVAFICVFSPQTRLGRFAARMIRQR